MHRKSWLAACLLIVAAASLQAAPFTPASDSEPVQKLPGRLDGAERAQRVQLARDPKQLPLALATARAAIERARRDGDPRELGLAQAALAPWWGQSSPPPMVRLLRATVRQSQHEFETALADLDVLADAGDAVPLAVQAQAGLTRASVLQVLGRLDAARQDCERLASPRYAALGRPLSIAARACTAELRSLRGQPKAAAAELDALLREAPGDAWVSLLRAELAERMGDSVSARQHFRAATAKGADIYAVAAFADWLLAQRRDAEALALLDSHDNDADALLLRRSIALSRLHDPRAPAAAAALRSRFEAARQRGQNFHAREEARLALDVLGQAPQALALARVNWAQQKEPADALLLVRAAAAAGDGQAAEPVRRLVRDSGWVDVRLTDAALKGAP